MKPIRYRWRLPEHADEALLRVNRDTALKPNLRFRGLQGDGLSVGVGGQGDEGGNDKNGANSNETSCEVDHLRSPRSAATNFVPQLSLCLVKAQRLHLNAAGDHSMNVKLFFGIALFLIGIVTAVIGITEVGQGIQVGIVAEQGPDSLQRVRTFAIPVIAGLSLALGGLLIGLALGNWKHPRTHLEPGDEIVDPEGYHKMKHV